jgi:hypothetical protein
MTGPRPSSWNEPVDPEKSAESPPPIPERGWLALQALVRHILEQQPHPEGPVLPEPVPAQPAAAQFRLHPTRDSEAPARRGAPDEARLRRALVRSLHARLAMVHRRIQEVQWLVLINDWPTVERLWIELAADLRTPLLELNFLAELVLSRLHQIRVEGHAFTDVLGYIEVLKAEVATLLARQRDVVELSSLLDYQMAPQIVRLQRFLERLEAAESSAT